MEALLKYRCTASFEKINYIRVPGLKKHFIELTGILPSLVEYV